MAFAETYEQRLADSTTVLHEMSQASDKGIPQDLLEKAQCVVVVPGLKKVAFVGGGIGYSVGVLLARLLGQKIFGFTPEPKLFLLFIVLLLASLITLLGSAYPLRRASQYDPAPILRGE